MIDRLLLPTLFLSVILFAGCRTTQQGNTLRSTQEVACQALHRAEYQSIECPAVRDRYGYSTNSLSTEIDATKTLAECISQGLAQNPSIQAIRFDIAAFGDRVTQVSSLPDPMVGSTVQLSPVQTAAGEQRFGLSLNQKFITGDKLDARATAVAHEKRAAQSRLAAMELEIAEKIQLAYFRLYYLQQAIEITNEDQQQLELIGDVVERRYRVKKDVSQQDVLNVEIERSNVATELVSLNRQKRLAQASLARLLHLAPESKIEAEKNLPMATLTDDVQSLYAQAIEARPELHEQLAKIQQNRSLLNLAHRQSIPDVTLGANWIATSSSGISPVANGDDAFMLMASFNLPRKARVQAEIREANHRACAEQTRFEALKDSTLELVTQFFTDYESQQLTLEILRDEIIPKAELALDTSLNAYEVGKVDMMQLIVNWRKLLDFQLTEKRLENELRKTAASLGRIVGNYNLNHLSFPFVELEEQEQEDTDLQSDSSMRGSTSTSNSDGIIKLTGRSLGDYFK